MSAVEDTVVAIPRGRWRVEAERSEIMFSLKHLLLLPVRGRFTDFEGLLVAAADGSATASGSVLAASVDTGDAKRDESLRGPNFFDVQRFPMIRLHGGRVLPRGRSRLHVSGDLEIRGVTREVELGASAVEIGGERIELALDGHLSRSAYGIESPQLLDAGISDRVEIALKLSLRRAR